MSARLKKSQTEKMLAGVCGGIAEYLDWDPSLVRILYVILIISSFGTMLLIYIVLALILPD